jgi:hypothetical protein
MVPTPDEAQQRILERDRIRCYERYQNNPEYRTFMINYITVRRQDPVYREHHNALQKAAYHRKKAAKLALENNKEDIPIYVD